MRQHAVVGHCASERLGCQKLHDARYHVLLDILRNALASLLSQRPRLYKQRKLVARLGSDILPFMTARATLCYLSGVSQLAD